MIGSRPRSGQEVGALFELAREIFLDHVVQAPFGEGLLLGADSHLQELLDRLPPGLVGVEERIVLQGVFRALDVDIEQGMCR